RPLLEEDAVDERDRLAVAGAIGHAPELLVASDLEVLEGEHERGELARRVRVCLEERGPVHRTDAHDRVLQRRDVAAARLEARGDERGMLPRLREVVVVDVGEDAVAQVGRTLEQLDRLLLDRVRVGKVLAQPLPRALAVACERRGCRAVEALLEPTHHRAFLAADLAGDAGDVRLAGAVGHARQQLVRGELQRLVRERVRDQLPGGVRLQSREEDEPLAADRHHRVLQPRRLRASLPKELAHHPLVAFGLGEMTAEQRGELGIAGDVGSGPQLRERLLLDRMRVAQVPIQLVLQALGHRLRYGSEARGLHIATAARQRDRRRAPRRVRGAARARGRGLLHVPSVPPRSRADPVDTGADHGARACGARARAARDRARNRAPAARARRDRRARGAARARAHRLAGARRARAAARARREAGDGDRAGAGRADFRAAAAAGRLREAPGVGPKTEARILAALERGDQAAARPLLLPRARSLVERIADALGGVPAGDPRRWRDSSSRLAVAVAADDPEPVRRAFASLPEIVALVAPHLGVTVEGTPVELVVAPASSFGTALVRATGSAEWVGALEPLPEAADEAGVFAALGLPFAPPELREGEPAGPPPPLVELGQIRG